MPSSDPEHGVKLLVTGYGVVWSTSPPWKRVSAGSNPAIPTGFLVSVPPKTGSPQGIAQSGSALRLERRGRKFKSFYPDSRGSSFELAMIAHSFLLKSYKPLGAIARSDTGERQVDICRPKGYAKHVRLP